MPFEEQRQEARARLYFPGTRDMTPKKYAESNRFILSCLIIAFLFATLLGSQLATASPVETTNVMAALHINDDE